MSGVTESLQILLIGIMDSRAPSLLTKTVLPWLLVIELMEENGLLNAAMKRTPLCAGKRRVESA